MKQERLAIFLPNWIGDVVMATPALRAIRKKYPPETAHITGIMKPYVARILTGTNWLDQTLPCRQKRSRLWPDGRELVQQLQRLRPTTIVYMTNSLRPALVGWLSGASRRVGFVGNGRGLLLTDRLHWPRQGWRRQPFSAVDFYLELASAVGCPPEPPRLELAITPDEAEGAEKIWNALELRQAERVVMLNLGSAKGTARHWPIEHYVQLARQIVQDQHVAVVVICGPGEEETARRIETAAKHPQVKSMAGQDLGLGVAKAFLSRAALLVTPDSGPRHIAAAFDVPTITLAGPIDPRLSDNHHPKGTVLYEKVTCRPCGRSVCPVVGHPCMEQLSPQRVFREVRRILENARSTRAA